MKNGIFAIAAAVLIGAAAACSNGVPLGPSDASTGSTNSGSGTTATSTTTTTTTTPTTPTAPTTPTPTTPADTTSVAYNQDIAPILNTDCLPCHNDRSAAGRYSVSSYAAVMRGVVPGSASSALVIVTRANGMMYGFLSGNRTAKSALITQWVLAGAPQNR